LYGELMSRIGKKPVIIPQGVKVEQKGQSIEMSGPLGKLQMDVHSLINVKVDNSAGKVLVEVNQPESSQSKELCGTTRSLIANMIVGVTKGFQKKMEIYGTGYNAKEQGGNLIMQVGYSHPVQIAIPKGVKVNIDVPATKGNDTPAKFTLVGMDKCVLGQFAADIRGAKPPEPYKGKGIRYADEHIKHKVGKAFASGTA
jgi:large subunit ribosomal protein L6